MPQQNPFFDVAKEVVATSAGDFELPLTYRDGSFVGLMYRVDLKTAAQFLEDTPFEPITMFGKALVQLVMFEYRKSSISPYQEVGLAVQVKRRGSKASLWGGLMNPEGEPDQGSYMLNLPVTSNDALVAGCEIWSFPKYQADISTDFKAEHVRVEMAGEFVFTVGKGGFMSMKAKPFVICSVHEGRILRSVFHADLKVRFGGGSSAKLELSGTGPTADNMRRLKLDTLRPLAVYRCDTMKMRLAAGVDMGPA